MKILKHHRPSHRKVEVNVSELLWSFWDLCGALSSVWINITPFSIYPYNIPYRTFHFRSITKILGDWWANLDQDEKLCYTNLAKQVTTQFEIHYEQRSTKASENFQYKDAFFSANPNFKWYKLPAPPLRTLSTRPGNTDRPPFNYAFAYDAAFITNDSMHRTNGSIPINEDTPTIATKSNRGPNVGIFKLADEAQMGGLNSLMASYDSKSPSGNNNLGELDGELGKQIRRVNFMRANAILLNWSFLCREYHQSVKNEADANKSNGTLHQYAIPCCQNAITNRFTWKRCRCQCLRFEKTDCNQRNFTISCRFRRFCSRQTDDAGEEYLSGRRKP